MSNEPLKINWNATNSQEMLKRSLDKIATDLNDIAQSNKKDFIKKYLKSILQENEELKE